MNNEITPNIRQILHIVKDCNWQLRKSLDHENGTVYQLRTEPDNMCPITKAVTVKFTNIAFYGNAYYIRNGKMLGLSLAEIVTIVRMADSNGSALLEEMKKS
jgi:hypothetical protein